MEAHEEQPRGHILLIEDDRDFAFGLQLALKRARFLIDHVDTFQSAKQLLHQNAYDAVLLDLTLPDAAGLQLISSVRKAQATAHLIVLTGRNDAELAVQSLRLGAEDYLTKPIRIKDLLKSLQNVLHQRPQWAEKEPTRPGLPRVIGDSPRWLQTMEMIQAAAEAPKTTVLVTGEPGVGKELAVQLLHALSERHHSPMIAVNVACLPQSLMESELFGHEAGAFTGAKRKKRGFFEQADGGSLFLDEIGELPLALQAKLLRVLEGKPFRRLGGEKDLNPNVRLFSATNRPLSQMAKEGLFRKDLYHRLKVLEIRLPPLRERRGDVEKLALHFLARLGAEMGHTRAYLSAEALTSLREYNWPGNIRELRNVVERALVLSRGGTIRPHHLPQELQAHRNHPINHTQHHSQQGLLTRTGLLPSDDLRLDTAIHHHVKEVLTLCDGNISKASERLGITRQTLRRRLQPPTPPKTTPLPLPHHMSKAPNQ